MPYEISAVITTYLRPDLLVEAIRSLCHQNISSNQYEILIADSASSPETEVLIQRFKIEYPDHRVIWLPITQNNTALARNTALQKSSSPFIAYMDDDAQAPSDWLDIGLKTFKGIEGVDCLGGPILPWYTTPKPRWFKDQYEARSWGKIPRWLSNGEAFSGSNMIWRRSTLDHIGGFNSRLGPAEDAFRLGEDTSAFTHAWENLLNPKFYYCPQMAVKHWVPQYKMSVSYILRRYLASGQVPIRLMDPLPFFRRIKILVRSIGAVVIYTLRAISRIVQYPTMQNWLVEEGKPVANKMGAVCATIGIWIHVPRK